MYIYNIYIYFIYIIYIKILYMYILLHQYVNVHALYINVLEKISGNFLWIGFNCLKARAFSRREFTFYH